jgi:hypothetical protein
VAQAASRSAAQAAAEAGVASSGGCMVPAPAPGHERKPHIYMKYEKKIEKRVNR